MDSVLFIAAILAAVLPWSGADALPVLIAGSCIAAFAGLSVWRGRWQATPVIAAGLVLASWTFAASWLAVALAVASGVAALLGAALLWAMPIPKLPRPSGSHSVGLKRCAMPREKRDALLLYMWYPATPVRRAAPLPEPRRNRRGVARCRDARRSAVSVLPFPARADLGV